MNLNILQKSDEQTLQQAVACLNDAGVILVPTDTVYGLAVLPAFAHSVKRLFDIKARPDTVNLPVMVANAGQLAGLGAIVDDKARALLESHHVPGAVTLVFGLDAKSAPDWLAGREEIAVRLPDDPLLLNIIAQTGPILATSANRHGLSTPNNCREILDQLVLAPDLAIDGGEIDTVPSTVVNCNAVPPVIERVGVVSEAEIDEVWHDAGE